MSAPPLPKAQRFSPLWTQPAGRARRLVLRATCSSLRFLPNKPRRASQMAALRNLLWHLLITLATMMGWGITYLTCSNQQKKREKGIWNTGNLARLYSNFSYLHMQLVSADLAKNLVPTRGHDDDMEFPIYPSHDPSVDGKMTMKCAHVKWYVVRFVELEIVDEVVSKY